MSFYENHILPHLIGFACATPQIMKQRSLVVPAAEGRVLEVGFGSGTNLEFYDPVKVERLFALEPSEGMRRKASKAVEASALDIEWLGLPGEEIPLDDDSVDTVVLTYTACTIPDAGAALSQMRRVLKPGGWFVFTGHDRNRHGRKGFWRDEAKLWRKGRQHPQVQEFGDLYYEADDGHWMYIHAADSDEVRADLVAAGFRVDVTALRSEICVEPEEVREFSDDTRFWVAQRLA